jgi:hypothetical protein
VSIRSITSTIFSYGYPCGMLPVLPIYARRVAAADDFLQPRLTRLDTLALEATVTGLPLL